MEMESEPSRSLADPISTDSDGENNEFPEDPPQEADALNPKSNSQLRYRCQKCPERFSTIAERSNHFIITHNIEQYKCDLCTEVFSKERTLERHMQLHLHPTCKICGDRLESPDAMTEHMKVHERSARVSTKKTADNHSKPLGGDNQPEVSDGLQEEPRSITSSGVHPPGLQTLLVREKTQAWAYVCKSEVDQNGEFTCSICRSPGFKQRLHLEVHFRRHFQEYVYSCRGCDHQFVSLSAANEHLKKKKNCGNNSSITNSRPTVAALPVSTKSIAPVPVSPAPRMKVQASTASASAIPGVLEREKTRAWAIAQEAQKVDAVRKFICPLCKATVNDRSNLEVHLRRHFRECICACPRCHRPFMCLSDMTVHMKHCSPDKANTGLSHQDSEDLEPIEGFHEQAAEEVPVKVKRAVPAAIQTSRHGYQFLEEEGSASESESDEESAVEQENMEHSPVLSRKGFAALVKREETQSFITSMNAEPFQSEPKRFECTFCGQNTFINRRNLEGHFRRRHFKEYLFSCTRCGKKLIDETATKRHKCTGHCEMEENVSDTTEIKLEAPIETEVEEPTECEAEPPTEFEPTKFEPFKRKKSRAYLNAIKAKPDPAVGNQYLCSVCKKKVVKTRILLEMHLRFHFNEYACVCHKCGKKFYTTSLLKKHNCNKFIIAKPRPCKSSTSAPPKIYQNSPEKTSRNSHLPKSPEGHSAVHSQDGSILFKCDHCPKMFRQRIALKFHERQHVGTLYKCDDCGKGYSVQSALLRHRRDSCHAVKNPTNQQQKISTSIFARSLLRRKIPIRSPQHEQKSAITRSMISGVGSSKHLKSTKNLHQNGDKFICKYCGRQFLTQAIRDGHEAIHLGKLPKCPNCNKVFKTLITLRRHRLYFPCEQLKASKVLPQINVVATEDMKVDEMKVEGTTFECTFCRKDLPSGDRINHLRQHRSNGDQYSCKFCEKTFTAKSSRRYHEGTHTGVSYCCTGCGKVFHIPSSLSRHRRFSCRPLDQRQQDSTPEQEEDGMQISIEKVWSESANIDGPSHSVPTHSANPPPVVHVRTADGNYKCSYCPKVYTSSWMKKYHENTHRGVKPYKCDACSKCFHSAIRRQCHRHAVHGLRGPVTAEGCNPPEYMVRNHPNLSLQGIRRSFKCARCDARFSQSSNGRRHMRNVHKSNDPLLRIVPKVTAASSKSALKIQNAPTAMHPCGYCGNNFQNLTLLQRHVQAVHMEQRQFECQFCHLGFLSEENFTKHVQNRLCSIDKIRSGAVKASRATYTPPTDALHECCFCAKQFSNISNLRGHERLHTGQFPYECQVCSRGYNDRRDLIYHLKKIHNTEVTADQVQPIRPPAPRQFSKRKPASPTKRPAMKPSKRRYACDRCDMVFYDVTELAGHTERQVNCNVCKKPFCSEEALEQHTEDGGCGAKVGAGEDGMFKCDYCDDRFTSPYKKKYHENRHKKVKPYKCDKCSARFYAPSSRQSHRRSAHGLTGLVTDPKCNPTDYPSGGRSEMYEKVGGVFQCRICKKQFGNSGTITVHLRQHTGEKPYQCRDCPESFRQTHHAKRHMLHHHNLVATPLFKKGNLLRSIQQRSAAPAVEKTSSGMLKCAYCNHTFKTPYQKKYHENQHRNVKPYKCDACDRSFYSPSMRLTHRKSAHGLKGEVTTPGCNPNGYRNRNEGNSHHAKVDGLYPCHFCDKKFTRLGVIKTHERLHTGERPYQCRVCDARFVQSTHCKRHMLSHHRLNATPISDFKNSPQKPQETSSNADSLVEMLQPIVEIEEVYRCEHCEDEFKDQEILERHVQVVHDEQRPFHCETCQRGFYSESNYEKHVKNLLCAGNYRTVQLRQGSSGLQKKPINPEELFECCYCSRQFSTSYNLVTHERRHTGETFNCQACDRQFHARADYQTHLMAKHGTKLRNDEIQPSAVASSPSGKGGRARGTGFEYPCSRCDKAFCDGAMLAAHVQNFHIERRPYHCEVCQRGFFSEAAYARHMEHQLCRRSAELELATAPEADDETAVDNLIEEEEIQRTLALRIQINNNYPWISRIQNGPFCYECVECGTKFTREIIAEAHRQWHNERNSNRSD